MGLKKYEAFAKTVELRSLTKAAEALGYTQSGMSHMLNSLEQEFGFPVLQRSRSGVKLTAAGEQMLPKIQEILLKKQEIDELASFLVGDNVGIVRVGAFTSVAVNWLPGIIKEYRKTHPAIEIRMFSGDYSDIRGWLEHGDIDLGFIALPEPEGVRCIPLKEDPLVMILPEGHPLTQYERVPITLAAKEPIISLPQNSAQDIQRALGEAGVIPEVKYATKDDYAIIAMVRAGLGISIMPQLLIQNHDRDIRIRHLSPEARRTIALAYADSRQPIPVVESFAQCIQKWVTANA